MDSGINPLEVFTQRLGHWYAPLTVADGEAAALDKDPGYFFVRLPEP